ncbi:MAG: DNA repair protein RadA [Myxococcales bacterium]|nr:DNA repair protein RadA [Myxococcales bacterium]
MAKIRSIYRCGQCQAEHSKWLGRCPSCGAWNAMKEETNDPRSMGSFGFGSQARNAKRQASENAPLKVSEIAAHTYERIPLAMPEMSRVLGGGLVPGSLILVGGDPGIGKSTLLSQVSGMIADAVGSVLYLSGEESVYQVKMRAERLGVGDKEVFLLSETNLELAIEHVKSLQPGALIVDSIQTVYLPSIQSSAGSITQVRECASRLMQIAKVRNIPVIMVGHVTKEGSIAGPRVLEHIVDTVIYLEGDRFHTFRLLRAQKNRFGSTNEVGVFEMREEGMIEVPNPSASFLSGHHTSTSGAAIAINMEGTRSILVELQALVSQSGFSQPRRTANGIDLNRLHMVLAVLSKRVGLQMDDQDIFINIVGGLKLREPANDLALAAAIASSFFERVLPRNLALVGEIGLGGEVRPVSQLDKRMNEAAKLGFTRCVIPHASTPPPQIDGIEGIPVRTLTEALQLLLEEQDESALARTAKTQQAPPHAHRGSRKSRYAERYAKRQQEPDPQEADPYNNIPYEEALPSLNDDAIQGWDGSPFPEEPDTWNTPSNEDTEGYEGEEPQAPPYTHYDDRADLGPTKRANPHRSRRPSSPRPAESTKALRNGTKK